MAKFNYRVSADESGDFHRKAAAKGMTLRTVSTGYDQDEGEHFVLYEVSSDNAGDVSKFAKALGVPKRDILPY